MSNGNGPTDGADKLRPSLTLVSSAPGGSGKSTTEMSNHSRPVETDETVVDGGESITTQAYRRLREDILFNFLKPAEKLRIDALRERYGLGTTPIREALSLLTSDGLVERFEQRGFRVAGATLDHFKDIHATRCWLEERALRESIAAATTDWEETIVLSHHRLSRAQRVRPHAGFLPSIDWEMLHRRFHIDLIANCPSPTLLRFCGQLYDLNIRYRYIAAATAYPARNVEDEHRSIADAVISRDTDKAVALLTQHFRRTGAFLEERLARGP